jgi:hypothetical protein
MARRSRVKRASPARCVERGQAGPKLAGSSGAADTGRRAAGRKSRATRPPTPAAALARVRQLCASLPETSEKIAWGAPTFRVRDKMFAMFLDDHHGDGRLALWCKAALGMQEILVGDDSERFFVPPYVGVKGWIGVRLDLEPDWDTVADLLDRAWHLSAPRRLAAARNAAG